MLLYCIILYIILFVLLYILLLYIICIYWAKTQQQWSVVFGSVSIKKGSHCRQPQDECRQPQNSLSLDLHPPNFGLQHFANTYTDGFILTREKMLFWVSSSKLRQGRVVVFSAWRTARCEKNQTASKIRRFHITVKVILAFCTYPNSTNNSAAHLIHHTRGVVLAEARWVLESRRAYC